MNILGIEFESNSLNYVLLETGEHGIRVAQANRLRLSETRSREALRSFQSAVSALLNGTRPDRIGVKEKPEKGLLQAGAAALKMEGILLAAAPCDVDFVSGKRVNSLEEESEHLKKYHQPAFKTALVLAREIG